MDRILKSEGREIDAYKVAKQADALMSFFQRFFYFVDGPA